MSKQRPLNYDISVFINCPFDTEYEQFFAALVFAVHDCGFIARSAAEVGDRSRGRIDKIFEIVAACRFGIHDISRTELDAKSKLPRFNMPLELGIFLAAKYYGNKAQRDKTCLVMEREEHLCRIFCSDLKGYDIPAHNGDTRAAVTLVRDWLLSETVDPYLVQKSTEPDWPLPSGSFLFSRYEAFLRELPTLRARFHFNSPEFNFVEHRGCCKEWLTTHPR